jgi:hypothetical protein
MRRQGNRRAGKTPLVVVIDARPVRGAANRRFFLDQGAPAMRGGAKHVLALDATGSPMTAQVAL